MGRVARRLSLVRPTATDGGQRRVVVGDGRWTAAAAGRVRPRFIAAIIIRDAMRAYNI